MPFCDSLFGPIRFLSSSRFNHLFNPRLLFPFGSYYYIKPIFYIRPLSHHDYSLRCCSYSYSSPGISYDSSTTHGLYSHLVCPKCHGGRSVEESADDGNGVHVLSRVSSPAKPNHKMTAAGLALIPLRSNLIAYFAGRMISKDVLMRNGVMQLSGNRNVIAFTYKRNGMLVSCKYRNLDKRFWQKCVEKIFYGIDDIVDADDIIIVEGEIDKLSMEEAGFLNCVSVPDGAPQKLTAEELPSPEKDSGFKYIWNCQDYLNKASRIILATDADSPGHVLAEELARRLGRERCWRVRWPKKDDINCFNDANEVLKYMGPNALRDVIDKAEPYRVYNFSQGM